MKLILQNFIQNFIGKVNELSDAIETISCKQCGRSNSSKMTSYKITSISDSM